MNAMYELALSLHFYGVLIMVALIAGNLVHLLGARQIVRYAKQMRIVMPMMGTLLFLLLFTGSVMMAAKHLSFSFENIVMIVINIVIIVLEAKRYGSLKHSNPKAQNALAIYRFKALRLLGIELVLIFFISLWMLV